MNSIPNTLGLPIDLVQTDAAYSIITENLLGNTIVAKTLVGASAIARALGYRFRVVTLDGDIVNAGGSLTGGGVKGQASVFTRKAELETLQKQLNRYGRINRVRYKENRRHENGCCEANI